MQVLSAREAANLVKDGDTIAVSGVVSLVTAEAVLKALGERFRETGSPRNLTVICPCRAGWFEKGVVTGLEHLAEPGMVSRLICSIVNIRDMPRLVKMASDNEIEAYIFPMGVLFRWLRECTAKSPGLLTEVGMGCFFDPADQSGGDMRVSLKSRELSLVKRVNVDGTECIFIRSIPINVAILKGTLADADGNVSMEGEPINAGVRQMAMAARTSGGRVITVVKSLGERSTIHPRKVEIPGIFVDAVVVDPEARQSMVGDEPAFTGETRTSKIPTPSLEFGLQKIILRRAALELKKGDVINLGIGIGSQLPALAMEEGFLDDVRFSIEHGALGGVPVMGVPGQVGAFGAHYNPEAIIDSTDLFDFYHGGGLDATLLGFAQIDQTGNINVGRYNGVVRGPGGFVDISHRTKKVLICGTLTSGSLEIGIERDGAGNPVVNILREGKHRKFVPQVEHIDLNGQRALSRNQKVLVITERCVFEVRPEGLTLIEVAPGIDIDRHIRPMLDFPLRIDGAVRVMKRELFDDSVMKVRLPDDRKHLAAV